MSIKEQAESLELDEKQLLAFYRGLGPKPEPKNEAKSEPPSKPKIEAKGKNG